MFLHGASSLVEHIDVDCVDAQRTEDGGKRSACVDGKGIANEEDVKLDGVVGQGIVAKVARISCGLCIQWGCTKEEGKEEENNLFHKKTIKIKNKKYKLKKFQMITKTKTTIRMANAFVFVKTFFIAYWFSA